LKDNLLEHHDFEALSKEIYKNLKKWYNADIDIIRFLKVDTLINNKMILDIYPEKKKNPSNSIDSYHSKRNVWSMDYQSFQQLPNSRHGLSNSRNMDDYNDVLRQSLSINIDDIIF